MDYKALIFDLDGTAMPLKFDALPSRRVVDTVKKAQKVLSVSAATGRSLPMARNILQALDLQEPCVISGGTQIIDPKSEKTLWEKRLTEKQLREIQEVCLPYDYEVLFTDEIKGASAKNKVISESERVVYIMATTKEDVEQIQNKLHEIDGIISHLAGSWTENRYDIHITHQLATKQHALEKLLDILKIGKKDAIGVGDNDNDLPLFASVGYKIAMGNATENLKAKADYITSTVEEDGLAEAIEKIILKA